MHLIYEVMTKNCCGDFEVSVIIVNEPNNFKKYDYRIGSEYALRRFLSYYRKGRGCHGIALSILNKFKIKGE